MLGAITLEPVNGAMPAGFDAWGLRRDVGATSLTPTLWTPQFQLQLENSTTRGYTGHEMAESVGIIHMNGRIYDPALGRFLQADPFVQSPGNSQSWNRYTYVFNNPLVYTDPSGYLSENGRMWLRTVVAVAITVYTGGAAMGMFGSGIVAGTAQSYAVAVMGGMLAGAVQTGTMRGAVNGGVSAGIFHGMNTYFSDLSGTRLEHARTGTAAAARTLSYGSAGGIMASLQGGRFGHGFASSGFSAAVAPSLQRGFGDGPIRATMQAVVGGTASSLGGGKFANGAVTGAMAFSFGQLANVTEEQRLEREGRPLTPDEREIFAYHFTEETLDSARIIDGKVPWWLRKDMAAITLGNRIHFREGVYLPGTASGAEILGHELVHVQQFAEEMTIFRYIWESRRGYSNNRFEIEAYSRGDQIRDSFCQSNPQAEGC